MIDRSPIKPGEMGIIIASAREDLRGLIGLAITCIRYAIPGEVVELTHPMLYGDCPAMPFMRSMNKKRLQKNWKMLNENTSYF